MKSARHPDNEKDQNHGRQGRGDGDDRDGHVVVGAGPDRHRPLILGLLFFRAKN